MHHYNNILQFRAYDVLLVLFNSSLPNFLALTKLENAGNRLDIATRDLSFFKARKITLGTRSMQSLTLGKTVAQQSVLVLKIKMAKTIMAIREQKKAELITKNEKAIARISQKSITRFRSIDVICFLRTICRETHMFILGYCVEKKANVWRKSMTRQGC